MHNIRIWNPQATGTNCYVDFLKDLTVTDTGKVELLISADTEYAVYLNDTFVARGQYHTFPHLPIYDSLDLSDYIRQGANRLAITVYYQGEQSYQYAKGEAGLWFVLRQNGNTLAQSDRSVLSAPSLTYQPGAHQVTPQYGFGFVYHACQQDDWRSFSDAIPSRFLPSVEKEGLLPSPRPVKKCQILPYHPGKLIRQGTFRRENDGKNPGLAMQTDLLTPTALSDKEGPINNPYYIWDLGRETAGLVRFTVTVPKGTVIDLGWGEHLTDHGVATHLDGRNFANRYVAKEGRQTFTHYFRRIAGRYLQMHINGIGLAAPEAGLLEEVYPIDLPPLPETGQVKMNRILHTARETLRQCMHEHYEDCPWREQALYAGDSWNQILCGYYAFREKAFPRANLDLMGQSMRPNGFLAITAPTDEHLQIPSFTFIWIMSMAKYIEYTGDLSLAKAYFPIIVNTLDQCTQSLPNGIAIHPFGKGIWNFYEWSDGCDGGNIFDPEPHRDFAKGYRDGLYQMFLYAAVKSSCSLAEALNKPQESKRFAQVLDTMEKGIMDVFWNHERQQFATFVINGEQTHYCQLMQAMALFNGIAKEHSHILCQTLTQENTLVPITLSYAMYLYEGLLLQGEGYRDFVWNDILEKWGAMLDAGATTFWETQLGSADFNGAGSLCHGWSAVPLYIICRFFLNITPNELNL